MLASYQHLGVGPETSPLETYWVRSQQFGFHWHYHPEYEITYVKKGFGTRIVGDSVESFDSGDLVLLGSDLPHTWISAEEWNANSEEMEVGVIQFHPDLISGVFWSTPEFEGVQALLQKARRGKAASINSKKAAAVLVSLIIETTGVAKMQHLIALLDLLSHDDDSQLLASKAYTAPMNHTAEQRVQQVCAYLQDHFTEPLRLEDVAAVSNLNSTSFCRFFKKATGQTMMEYVTDLRISRAQNLLLSDKTLSITDVAHMSGFASQTMFNRAFRRKNDLTPREFRRYSVFGSP